MGSQEIKKRIIEGMRENGLKLTRQRRVIIDILAGTKTHPRAQDILTSARQKIPAISLSTVYLTLDTMKRAGLIKELEFANLDNRYEGDISDHLNLVCRRCGEIIDFPTPLPPALKDVEKKVGFRGDCVRFEYYGYCRKCRRNRDNFLGY
jgi:Fur family peroxide stress response transcriptional regulator